MHFIDDVDFITGRDRGVAGAVQEVAHVGDACAGGGIEFQHIRVAAGHDGLAMVAGRVEMDGRGVVALARIVEAAGEQARRGGLADAAHASEHEGMGNAARLERVRERADHGLLADQVGEEAGPVFAGENLIGLGLRANLFLSEHGEGLVVALRGFRFAHRGDISGFAGAGAMGSLPPPAMRCRIGSEIALVLRLRSG